MATKMNVIIDQGASFSLPVACKNPDDTAFNLTGWTMTGEIRRTHRSTVVRATFTCTITTPPGTDGKFTASLTATQTNAITAGETVSDPRSQYIYLITMTNGTLVKRVLEGAANISPK